MPQSASSLSQKPAVATPSRPACGRTERMVTHTPSTARAPSPSDLFLESYRGTDPEQPASLRLSQTHLAQHALSLLLFSIQRVILIRDWAWKAVLAFIREAKAGQVFAVPWPEGEGGGQGGRTGEKGHFLCLLSVGTFGTKERGLPTIYHRSGTESLAIHSSCHDPLGSHAAE